MQLHKLFNFYNVLFFTYTTKKLINVHMRNMTIYNIFHVQMYIFKAACKLLN